MSTPVKLAAFLCGAQLGCSPAPAPEVEREAPAAPAPPAATAAPPSATPPAEPPAKPALDAAAQAVTCAPEVPADATLVDRLELFRSVCGGVLLASREDGLHALTPTLEPIVRILDKRVRWLQARRDGEARELYYFPADAPDLVHLDLRTGREEVLVSLPRLKHRCFTGAEPGQPSSPADPVDFIQSTDRLDLDLAAGVLCLDIGDRNENMASIGLNLRADLRTRKVEQRTVFVTEDCQKGAGREREPACRPARSDLPSPTEIAGSDRSGLASPSGHWSYYSDEDFGASGDYMYSAAFLFDTRSRTAYAVTPTALVKFTPGTPDAPQRPPETTCLIPAEAQARWMPGRDLLILEGCGEAGLLIVEPPGRVQKAQAHAVIPYP
ncbi:hypothetical protein [Nannocystis bainbridge]|uniref:Uncharacterized protein n=1 Tax=Nannocystis bainbridge TaxID=2995303 RepID=A0ABT5E392_9BACT|nr:hypothetical protein [Nannocystis bainbridge]MDC0720337.1 hypothetical protein [Nannocystis bainbridge]